MATSDISRTSSLTATPVAGATAAVRAIASAIRASKLVFEMPRAAAWCRLLYRSRLSVHSEAASDVDCFAQGGMGGNGIAGADGEGTSSNGGDGAIWPRVHAFTRGKGVPGGAGGRAIGLHVA